MKSTWPLTSAILIALGIGAAATYGIARNSSLQSEQRIAKLQAALDCQTDVLAPFIQAHKLAQVRPLASKNFGDYVTSQVKAGLVPESAAQQFLATLKATGLGEPIYTSRGWVMPIIEAGK